MAMTDMANRNGKSMASAIGNEMPRYGTVRDETERKSHQAMANTSRVPDAAGAVDNPKRAVLELEPWVLREQRIWRHVNTFGGYRWPLSPREAEPPMSVDEALDELEWLLCGGMAISLALEQIPGRTPGALQQAATRRGRTMLARRIGKVAEEGRSWESGTQKRKRRDGGHERKTA
jgi:hypothetical protein